MPRLTTRMVAAGVTEISWAGVDPDPVALTPALRRECEQQFAGGARRVQLSVPAGERGLRGAVLRAGFRQEGVRRAVDPLPRGDASAETFGDVVDLARLAADDVTGPGSFSAIMNTALPRKRLIAHVLFRDARHRVLLCETTFKTDWELPGGIVEPLEPPRVGAGRELVEELGVALPVGRLLVCDWMPPYLGWEDALELIFDGGVLDEADLDTFALGAYEIVQARFVTLAEAAGLVTPLSHRRLVLATEIAVGDAPPAYTEDGRRPR